MKRTLSTKKYLLAFCLTLLIFSAGIGIGILLEDARLASAQQSTLQQKVSLRSLQLQQQYIASGADCTTLNKILDTSINELQRKLSIVLEYEKRAVFNQAEFDLQLQDYFLTEIQFYLISKEIDQQCAQDSLKVLFFYDENEFDTQGEILGYLKKRFQERLLIFSFNGEFEEPMIKVLLTANNITKFPAVVIEDKSYQGHQSLEALYQTLCEAYVPLGRLPQTCVEGL